MSAHAASTGRPLRVSVASLGPYHVWNLAEELRRRGMLGTLFTGHPRWRVPSPLRSHALASPWGVAVGHALARLRLESVRLRYRRTLRTRFGRWVASRLGPCDSFVWLSGTGLEAQRVARERYGALTVCDVGASHGRHWNAIVAEEHERFDQQYTEVEEELLERLVAEYDAADVITVPSRHVLRSFVRYGVPAEKVAVVPYGVDLSRFRPHPKEDDTFRVVFSGEISLRKGVPHLLEAVQDLDLPDFEVCLSGRKTAGIDRVLAPYEGSYRWLGHLPRERVAWFMSQGSVFVMPSIEEGLALVQAQAMACGLPIIATTNTGAEDLIEHGKEGFIVPIRDPAAIRDRILALYHDRDLRDRMAAAALQRARGQATWSGYGDRYAALLRERSGAGASTEAPAEVIG